MRALNRDDAEATIREIWEHLLGVDVSGDDDFFDLGGYSLLVATVVAEARKSGLPMTARDVLTHRTPAALAAALRSPVGAGHDIAPVGDPPDFASVLGQARPVEPAEPGRALVTLADGVGTPIFCFHWDLGNIRFMRGLVDRFRGNRPVLGTEAVGLWTRARPSTSLEETAAGCLRQIRLAQPHGPYLFLGLCGGGRLAYEVTRQLTARGERVEVLALVNTAAPGIRELDPAWGLRERYEFRIDLLRHWFGVTDFRAERRRLIDEMVRQAWVDEGMDPADLYWRQVVWAAESFAQDNYAPRRYEGGITLFQSIDHRLDGPWAGTGAVVRSHPAAVSGTLPMLHDASVAAALREEFADVVD